MVLAYIQWMFQALIDLPCCCFYAEFCIVCFFIQYLVVLCGLLLIIFVFDDLCFCVLVTSICVSIQAIIWNWWALLFCMKTVAELIIGVRVIVGLRKLINTSVPAKSAHSIVYAVAVRLPVKTFNICLNIKKKT